MFLCTGLCSGLYITHSLQLCSFCVDIDIGSSVVALIGVGIAVYVLGLTEHLVALLFFFKKTQGEYF